MQYQPRIAVVAVVVAMVRFRPSKNDFFQVRPRTVISDDALFTTRLDGGNVGEVGRQVRDWLKGFDVEGDQADGAGMPKLTAPFERSTTMAIPTTFPPCAPDNIESLLHAAALGHHVLDDKNLLTGFDLESASQNQLALFFFNKNESEPELSRDFLTDDQAAHRGGNHRDGAERF